MEDMLSRVTILAVGVEKYQNLRPLYGPSSDVENLYNLFVASDDTAIFQDHQFIKIVNPSYEELRNVINDYVLGRSAIGDILVFYFSGHGIPLGVSDFGFCTIDTTSYPGPNVTLPLTVIKISDLVRSLAIVGVIPLVIIDACYSGQAGNALIAPNDAISTIKSEIMKASASAYALLCSCSSYQTTVDSPNGGVFSNLLFDTLINGVTNNRISLIGLREIFQPLREAVENETYDSYPLLFLGETMPDFSLAKNVSFLNQAPQSYSYVGHLSHVIEALWNAGDERELSPNQIREICGNGAYGNHQKLSLVPWGLVENVLNTKKRKLSERGKLFVEGKLTIPRTIFKNEVTGKWEPAAGTSQISFISRGEEQSEAK
ncbi:MAG: caspase family protein [Anaerolineales bacterium]